MLKSKLGWEGDTSSSSASKIRRKHFQAVNVVVLLVHSMESLHEAVEDYLFHQSHLPVDSRSGYSDTDEQIEHQRFIN